MAVTRDVDVPALETIRFVRVGKIVRVETLPDGTGLVVDSPRSPTEDIDRHRRAAISPDPAGDGMRSEVFRIRGVSTFDQGEGQVAMYILHLSVRIPVTLAVQDWLWVEA